MTTRYVPRVVRKVHQYRLARALARRLLRNVAIAQRFHGGRIYLDAVEHSWAWTSALTYEGFDRELQDALLELSLGHERFIDIGCNIGVMTVSVLLRNPRIEALAVDPNPRAVALLRRTLRRNGLAARATVVQAAVDTQDGSVPFDTAGSVTGHVAASAPTTARSIGLSRLLAGASRSQGCLVKLDVEGYEAVLLPSLEPPAGPRPVCLVVELHPRGFNGMGDPRACVDALRSRGAALFDLAGRPFELSSEERFTQVVARWTGD